MKWFAVLILLTQAFRALSCAFDRVETLTGNLHEQCDGSNENDCFARCFEDVACIGIGYRKMSVRVQIKRSKYPYENQQQLKGEKTILENVKFHAVSDRSYWHGR